MHGAARGLQRSGAGLAKGRQPRPVVVHLHGAGASGADVVRDSALVDPIVARGYVVIAPSGLVPPGRTGGSWSFGSRPPMRDELAFVEQVLADAQGRFSTSTRARPAHRILGGRLARLVSGLSGARRICRLRASVRGFWKPPPAHCAGPVKLLHTHGWLDETVPLEGRQLRPGLAQSDIFAGLKIWRAVNGCAGERPDRLTVDGPFWRRAWTRCTAGSALELILHPGVHEVPDAWPTLALDWFEAVVPETH